MDHSRLVAETVARKQPASGKRIASRRRLAELFRLARTLHASGQVAPHWPLSRFEQIEQSAEAILASPPPDLATLAIDAVRMVRLLLGAEMATFTDAFEEVGARPEWRVPYLSYLIPFLLSVAEDTMSKLATHAAACGQPA
jgi:hypothetical protein